jgi:outer membrane immunogenic protein
MNKLLLGSVVLFALAIGQPSLAADMATKAPPYNVPPVAVASTWTGCYGGGNLGGGWGPNKWTAPSTAGEQASNSSGIVGGVQAGCDYQINNWVIGARGMFDWSSLSGSYLLRPTDPEYIKTQTPWFGDAAARLGVTVGTNILLYGLGGIAWARDKYTDTAAVPLFGFPAGTLFFTADAARAGWIVGVGAEWMFAPHWSLFAEYDHLGLGTQTVTLVSPVGFGRRTNDINQNIETILVGVNYHFVGPLVARN